MPAVNDDIRTIDAKAAAVIATNGKCKRACSGHV